MAPGISDQSDIGLKRGVLKFEVTQGHADRLVPIQKLHQDHDALSPM
jgi:hypothetical protein